LSYVHIGLRPYNRNKGKLMCFCPFSFSHCVVRPSLNYGFWLSLWYLQTFNQFVSSHTIFSRGHTSVYVRKQSALNWAINLFNHFSVRRSCIIWLSEAVIQRRADNTMAKRKRTKGQTTFYKTILPMHSTNTLTLISGGCVGL
jgi:hypothetical protein